MYKQAFLFHLLVFLCLTFKMVVAQQYSFGLSSNVQWHSEDFYLNYKAVANPDLESSYLNGEESYEIEQYDFEPLWTVAGKFTYIVKNPRQRRKQLAYSIGLGYSKTGFSVTPAKRIYDRNRRVVMRSGFASQLQYHFGYLTLPLEAERIFLGSRGKFFASLGLQVNNYILVSKEASRQVLPQDISPEEELNDYRITSARDYWFSLVFKPRVGIILYRNWLLSLYGRAGLTPLNLLKAEESLYARENSGFTSRDIKVHEETDKLNFLYGAGISIAYRFQ